MNTPMIGAAAEAYAKYKLISWGYPVHETQEGLGYDLVVQAHGELYKVQVKGTNKRVTQNGNEFIQFNARRGKNQTYSDDAYDIIALVDLKAEKVLFQAKDKRQCIKIKEIEFRIKGSRESFKNAYREVHNERIRRQYKISNSGK